MTPKQRSRGKVVQALYQWQVSGEELAQIEDQFLNQKEGKISKAFFSNLLQNIGANRQMLDNLIEPHLDRKIKELGCVEHAILYLGAYELKFSQVPYKVAINEAVDLAKMYAAQDSYKLINSALDKLSKTLRCIEVDGKN